MNDDLLKELRLSVGVSPANKPQTKNGNFTTLGGFHGNADDVFQKRYSLVNEDEEESEEQGDKMASDILEYRVYKHNQYQLVETLENIDEGILQKGLDLLKAVPGLDQVVGDIELYMQAGDAKESFDGLTDIVNSLEHAAGTTALALFGTEQQYQELVSKFAMSIADDKEKLKSGVEKLLDILKNMMITAAQTFDSVVALPTFAAAGIGGVVGETAANIITSLGTFIRDQPVEQFVFKTLTDRSGIVAKVVELFEKVFSLITAGGAIGKALGYVVDKISKTGGEIIELFLTKPFELFRRLGDLYKAAIGEPVEGAVAAEIEIPEQPAQQQVASLSTVYESNNKYSILFLLEQLDEKAKPDYIDLDGDGDKEEPMKKAAKDKKKKEKEKNEKHHHHESSNEIEEMSTAGAVAGFALPLGKKPRNMNELEKAISEQRERIAILQAYHQKTSNRLK